VARDSAERGIRVLHILAPAAFGGLERVVRDLSIGQQARGHQVRALVILDLGEEDRHPLVAELRAGGVEVDAVGVAPRAYRVERMAVRNAIAEFRPRVVHTHGARVDVLDAPVARHARVPTVATVHGFTGGGWKNRFYEYLQRRSFRRSDAVVAVSAPMAVELAASGVTKERLHTVPNAWAGGDPPMDRSLARAALHLSGVGGPVIGWVGRLTEEKGADVFIEALARLGGLGVTGVIVGDGPDRARLEALAVRLCGGGRVRWPGVVRPADRVLSAFDVFVLSSRTEGTPMVLFEAIAAGIPVVATAVGGIPGIVGSAEAELVPSENPDALAAAIRGTLADPTSAQSRAGAAQSRLTSHFGLAQWLDRYDEIYRRVIRRGGATV
jgi:glycosyltransferase involved in cell wall biosynthesis